MRTSALILALLCLVHQGALAQQGHERPGTFNTPSIVNPSWSMELSVGRPNTIAATDYTGQRRWYWYMPYMVTNNTGEDRLFTPEVTILNDKGQITRAGRGVPPTVFPLIAQRLNNELLLGAREIIGPMLQGEDFAKQSVAIWPVSEFDIDQFTVFFGGLDGETQEMRSPVTGEVIMQPAVDPITDEPILGDDGQPRMEPVMVRRTRALTFTSPGTERSPRHFPAQLIARDEVMR